MVTRRDVLAFGAGALGTLAAGTDMTRAAGAEPDVGGGGRSFTAKNSLAAEHAGFVQDLLGNATASLNGNTRNLAIKENVLVGDVVKTAKDARLALLLGSRTTLQLGGGTELRIDQYIMDAGGEIDLTSGTISFDRTGAPSETNLRFKTPYALIAVRGTAFLVGVNDGAFQVYVQRGKIEVSAGGKAVDVVTGQGTEVRPLPKLRSFGAHAATPSDPSIWGSERIRELRSKL